MAADGVDTFIEVGPGKVLTNLIKRIAPDATAIALDDVLAGEGLDLPVLVPSRRLPNARLTQGVHSCAARSHPSRRRHRPRRRQPRRQRRATPPGPASSRAAPASAS